MAKRPLKDQQSSESTEIRQLLDGLYKIVQTTNATSKEQVRINRELLKTMAVLQGGFAKNEDDAKQLISDVKDGLELTDEYAKKWLKKLEATDEQVEEILDKFRDLEKVDMDLIDNAEDYLDILEQRYDILDDTLDITKRLLTNHDAITNAIRQSKKVTSALGGSLGGVSGQLEKVVLKKVAISTMFDGMGDGLRRADDLIATLNDDVDALIDNMGSNVGDIDLHFNPLTGDLERELADVMAGIDLEKNARLDGLKQYFDVNGKLQKQLTRSLAAQMSGIGVTFDVDTGDISTATGILQRGGDEYEAMIQRLDDIAASNNITDKLKVDFKKIADLIALGNDKTEQQQQELTSLLTPMGMATKMLSEQVDIQNRQLDAQKSELAMHASRYKMMGDYIGQMKTVDGIVDKIASGFDSLNAILPQGIGDFLGLSKASATLLESHKSGLKSMTDQLMQGASKADAMRTYYKEITPALTSALNPMTILVASTFLLFKYASNVSEKYKEIAQRTGASVMQAKKLYETQLDILTSSKNQFATMEDISEAQSAMIGSSGKLFNVTDRAAQDLTVSLIETGKAFGYGTEQAVDLHKTFKRLGADDTLSLALQKNVAYMSEMAGIAPGIVTQDLIDSSNEVATYFAGMPDKAAAAAVQVRRMGMSLKQAGQIAQKMLNLEGFMTDMYELQAMTGGGIDFSEAFDLGLSGDLVGMSKSMVEQIGSMAEYSQMDFLTRQKIANTMGIQVDELANMVRMHEDMTGLSAEQASWLEANYGTMGDITKLSKDELKDRLNQGMATDRMGVAWEKIKGTLVSALLPAVELIADSIASLSPLFDLIMLALKPIAFSLKISLQILRGFMLPIKMIATGLEKVGDWIGNMTGGLEGAESVLDKITTGAYYFGAAIGAAFAILSPKTFFGTILGGFSSLFKMVFSFIPGLGQMFGGVFKIFGSFGQKAGSTVTDAAKSSEAAAATSIGSTKNVAESTIAHITDVATKAVEQVKTAATGVSDALSGVSASAASYTAPVTAATTAMVTDVKKKSKEAVAEVKSTATQTAAVVEQVQAKGKKGFISAGASKTIFKSIGAIGATTFATLAVTAAGSFFKAGEAGEESMSNVAQSSVPLFGSAFAMLGPMLFSSLAEGFEKFIRKQLEGKFEEKLDPVMKKVSKKVATIGAPTEKALEKASEKGTSLFGGMFDKIKKVSQKPLESVKQAFGGIFGKVPDPSTVTGTVETVTEQVEKTKKMVDVEEVTSKKQVSPDVGTGGLDTQAKSSGRSIKKTFSNISDAIKSSWDAIKASIKDVIKFGIDTVKQLATGIVDVAKILVKGVQSISGALFEILKSASKTLKSILGDIASVVSNAMKQLGSGIGEAIKGVLKGIGDGLSSFKGSAVTGAAALLVLSGALWVTSKAMQNFASVSWSDVGKGIVSMGALAVTASVLGKMSGEILKGSLAIAVLGASLIPAAYAFGMFNSVDWSALAKAGVAIIGLATVAGVLGAIMMSGVGAAALALGAVAIAGLGAALIPAAYAMKIFSESAPVFTASIVSIVDAVGGLITNIGNAISNILTSAGNAIVSVVQSISGLADIDVGKLLAVGLGLTTFGASMIAFGASLALSAIPIMAGVAVLGLATAAVAAFGSALSTVTVPAIDVSPLNALASVDVGGLLAVGAGLLAFGGMLAAFGGLMLAAVVPVTAGVAVLGLATAAVTAFGSALSGIKMPTIDVSPLNALASVDVGGLLAVGAGLLAFGGMLAASSAPIILGASSLGIASVMLLGITAAIYAFGSAVSGVDTGKLADVKVNIKELTDVDPTKLFSLASGLTAVSGSLLAFSAMKMGSSMMSAVSSLFGNDVLKDLDRLAQMADPLYIAAESIRNLAAGIGELGNVLESVDLGGLSKLKEVGKVSMERDLTENINARYQAPPMADNQPEAKVIPFQINQPKVATPRKEAVAQDVRIVENMGGMNKPVDGVRQVPASPAAMATSPEFGGGDTYISSKDASTKKIEFLLEDVKKLLEAIYKKPSNISMDGYRVGKLVKVNNNNQG